MSDRSELADEITPDLFDESFDSDWWEANRGRPPLFVLLGLWIFALPPALSVAGIPAMILFACFVVVGIKLDVIGNHDGWSPPVVVLALLCVGIGLVIARRALRKTLRTTRQYLLLSRYSSQEVDRALAKHERAIKRRRRSDDRIGIFKWTGDLPPADSLGPDDDHERWAYEACEMVAESIVASLAGSDQQGGSTKPRYDGFSWQFDVKFKEKNYSVAVVWVHSRDAEYSRNWFAILPGVPRGFVANFFQSRPSDEELRPVCLYLTKNALRGNRSISKVKWVDEL